MENKVAVIDRASDIIGATCTKPNEDAMIIIRNREIVPLEAVDRIMTPRPRENCPRTKDYTTEKRIGCIGCMHALIDYGDVLVWPITPIHVDGFAYDD